MKIIPLSIDMPFCLHPNISWIYTTTNFFFFVFLCLHFFFSFKLSHFCWCLSSRPLLFAMHYAHFTWQRGHFKGAFNAIIPRVLNVIGTSAHIGCHCHCVAVRSIKHKQMTYTRKYEILHGFGWDCVHLFAWSYANPKNFSPELNFIQFLLLPYFFSM